MRTGVSTFQIEILVLGGDHSPVLSSLCRMRPNFLFRQNSSDEKGAFLTKEELENFKKRLNQHFLSELCIMRDIIESHLSKDELKELKVWMKSNPYDSVFSLLQNKAKQLS